jgi:patatin-related protein
MSETQTHGAAVDGARPLTEYTQEIRFAVVMYGGSSLAIYMNGVAQELLRLVRATAPERGGPAAAAPLACFPDDGLRGSERVYRKLGRMLARGDEEGGAAARALRAEGKGPLRTRFVVDVLTGTSAGGINAVYLAKALANDQNLDALMGLWRTKGDIDVLLNVKSSARIAVGGGGRSEELDFGGQPASPLNSRRMYWELLDALRGMDRQAGGGGPAPLYAEEIDLYVTATDTRGRVMNMRLADKVVQELRNRNVFHFRYRNRDGGETVNDFESRYNPFLAFAARCTSAHQAAFEVMSMESGDETAGKIDAAVGELKAVHETELRHPSTDLQKFYEDYLVRGGHIKLWKKDERGRLVLEGGKPVEVRPDELSEAERRERLAEDFYGRYFNDGGTLDNSPFSFVADVLPFRQTLHPVDRKLLYVEPSPDHPEEDDPGNRRWNFIKNAVEGLSTLPSHQTIVEDLTRIQDRNRLVERVNHILTDLREDIRARNRGAGASERRPERGIEELRRMKLSDLIREHGVSWGGYQRLRIAQVTNDLTLLIARAAGLDEESDEFQAVRYLVRYWRLSRYEDHEEEGGASGAEPAAAAGATAGKVPEINFLIDFDLSWTIRRVQFLLRTVDELDCLDKAARRIAEAAEQAELRIKWPENVDEEKEFREELRDVRREVNKVYGRLRKARRDFWARRDEAANPNPFRDEVDALEVSKELLLELLRLPGEQKRKEMIEGYLGKAGRAAAFAALSKEVQGKFRDEIFASVRDCKSCLDHAHAGGRLGLRDSVRHVLSFYYNSFEDFDQVTFPIFYSTDVGEETDTIEVFRVSPEDACLLVDEKKVNEKRPKEGGRLSKLAGTTVGHFGAFFDERWRVNDILWGRLDGAERIISALLPGVSEEDAALRERFVHEAHAEIIRETWDKLLSDPEGVGKDPKLAAEVRRAQDERPHDPARPRALEGRLKDHGVGAFWRRYFLASVGEGGGRDVVEDFERAFLESYEEERRFSKWRKVKMAGMACVVIVKILHANLKENRRKRGPAWGLLAGLLLTLGGLAAFLLGLLRTIGGLLRLVFNPSRRPADKAKAGGGS